METLPGKINVLKPLKSIARQSNWLPKLSKGEVIFFLSVQIS